MQSNQNENAHRRLLIRLGIQSNVKRSKADAGSWPRFFQTRTALLAQRLEYGVELLAFGRVWIDIPQAIRHPYVIGPHLLFEAIKFGNEASNSFASNFSSASSSCSCSLPISQ